MKIVFWNIVWKWKTIQPAHIIACNHLSTGGVCITFHEVMFNLGNHHTFQTNCFLTIYFHWCWSSNNRPHSLLFRGLHPMANILPTEWCLFIYCGKNQLYHLQKHITAQISVSPTTTARAQWHLLWIFSVPCDWSLCKHGLDQLSRSIGLLWEIDCRVGVGYICVYFHNIARTVDCGRRYFAKPNMFILCLSSLHFSGLLKAISTQF